MWAGAVQSRGKGSGVHSRIVSCATAATPINSAVKVVLVRCHSESLMNVCGLRLPGCFIYLVYRCAIPYVTPHAVVVASLFEGIADCLN